MAADKQIKIAIVGGGVIGLTTGIALQENISDQLKSIVIISDQWTPNTTGDVSAGLIYPYLTGKDTPSQLMEQILTDSMEFYNRLLKDPHSGTYGISLLTMYELFENIQDAKKPIGNHTFPLIRDLTEEEIHQLFPKKYHYGTLVNTFIAEPKLFLPYLMEQFKQKNGYLITAKIDRLDSLNSQYDLIINCTGIGTKYLQDIDDEHLQSVRGQVIRVKAPWIRHAVMDGQWYIIPQNDCIVLGGTKDKDNYSLVPDSNIEQIIFEKCCQLVPSLKYSTKIGDFVGLRPFRCSLRIERDPKNKQIIHNYGHGGSGVTLAWGSALEVVKLVKQCLK